MDFDEIIAKSCGVTQVCLASDQISMPIEITIRI